MRLILGIKAFFKALKDPARAEAFVADQPQAEQPKRIQAEQPDLSHLRLLALLQQSGRLIDFLKEDISQFSDAQVGGAVRQIHQDCAESLEDLVTLRPVMDQNEGMTVTIPKGYDPAQVKLVGNVRGEAPFSGILVHKGWKAHKRSLPKKVGEQTSEIICPAEVEIK